MVLRRNRRCSLRLGRFAPCAVSVLFAAITAAAADPAIIRSASLRGTHISVKLETQAGQRYDMRTIERDVRRLWSTRRFNDVRVNKTDGPDGTNIIFDVQEEKTLRLRRILIEPSDHNLKLHVPEGAPISPLSAHEIAMQAQKELLAGGYLGAHVDSELIPYNGNEADVRLTVHSGDAAIRVNAIEFVGSPVVSNRDLKSQLQALRIHDVVRLLPKPRYNAEAVEADVARLHSYYMSQGYFDAIVGVNDVVVDSGAATVKIRVDAGPRYRVQSISDFHSRGHKRPQHWASDVCTCFLQARRDAERKGILDFRASVKVEEADGTRANLTIGVEPGAAYRVGRIDFSGSRHYGDAAIRRNLILNEGEPLDERLLRASVQRLNESMMFEPVNMRDVIILTDQKTGTANIGFHLRDRRFGTWSLSGPVGPASFAGPLEASLTAKLPPWGRGVFEMSTYTASVTMLAFASPILSAAGLARSATLLPILALRRPFTPVAGWLSGFTIAPQVGWKIGVLGYATTQLRRRTTPLLDDPRNVETQLAVEVVTPHSTGPLLCQPASPRLHATRRVAALALQFAGALTAF